MSRGHKVPKLPQDLLDQIGGGDAGTGSKSRRGKRQQTLGRKDQRKQLRSEKKTRRQQHTRERYTRVTEELSDAEDSEDDEFLDKHQSNHITAHEEPQTKRAEGNGKAKSVPKDNVKESRQSKNSEPASVQSHSRTVQAALDKDDQEIAWLEKQLGIKSSKKRPRAFAEDGLDDLLDGIDELVGNDIGGKEKQQDKDWLASKRRRVERAVEEADESESDDEFGDDFDSEAENSDILEGYDNEDEDVEDEEFEEENLSQPEDSGEEDFIADPWGGSEDGSESDENSTPTKKVRENPYVPPVAPSSSTTKYVPPHLRAAAQDETEALSRLRRQLQGLLNRLSEANMLSILKDVENIYYSNPRQHVTSLLIDLLVDMICDRTSLLDTFIILHAGFLAAVYKVIGSQFGAQLLERLVSEYDKYYNDGSTEKQTTNLLGLLSDLYTFQVTTSTIIFDFIRHLLSSLSELNTELLLKIIRSCGPQLRQDDARTLKDIVILLQKAVAEKGESNLSVRTKFMIETINNLKNNRFKKNEAAGSAVATEHIMRMKKILGSLRAKTSKASEPLGIGLQDIRNADKGGKWWLVGASWRNEPMEKSSKTEELTKNEDTLEEVGGIDLLTLARQHRMNTDVRRAIFVAVMGANDCVDAQSRLSRLRLSKSQHLEIPPVLLHCCSSETSYNRFYTLVSKRLCSEHRYRKAFQFRLWGVFRKLGEKDQTNEDDGSDDDTDEGMSLRAIVSLATMYAELISSGSLPITVLKILNFAYLQPKTIAFLEVLFTSVFQNLDKKASKQQTSSEYREKKVFEVFSHAKDAPQMLSGLQIFLRKHVRKSSLAEDSDTVREMCRTAIDTLVLVGSGANS